MWLLFQASIIGAVCVSNVYWPWTPNKILPGLIGVGLAYLVTLLCWKLRLKRG